MKNSAYIRRLLRSTVLSGAAIAAAAPALAQDDAADSDDVVIVTGTRLTTNPNLTAANPVLSVSDEEIDVRGVVRIEDLVNTLPQLSAGQTSEVRTVLRVQRNSTFAALALSGPWSSSMVAVFLMVTQPSQLPTLTLFRPSWLSG